MAKKLAIVALVVLILLLVIPLGIGMSLGTCSECTAPGMPGALGLCLTIVLALVVVLAGFTVAARPRVLGPPAFGYVWDFERPPRLAS